MSVLVHEESSSYRNVPGGSSNQAYSEETSVSSSHRSRNFAEEHGGGEILCLPMSSSETVIAIVGSDDNLTSHMNGGTTLIKGSQDYARSPFIQAVNRSLFDEVSQQDPTSDAYPGTAITQMNDSDRPSLAEDLQFWITLALWAGGISFAAMFTIIFAHVALASANINIHSLNVGAASCALIFILCILLLVLTKFLPNGSVLAAIINIFSTVILFFFCLIIFLMLSLVM